MKKVAEKMNLTKGIVPAMAVMAVAIAALPAHAMSREDYCQNVAKMMQLVAETKKSGVPEKEMLAVFTEKRDDDIRKDKPSMRPISEKTWRTAQRVVTYTYTMSPEPAQARKIGYIKCQAGNFEDGGAFDPELPK